MFSTIEVYFHRQNTLNLTNTNLGKRDKNNNPFQRDSYLQNNNTILCIVIKYKTRAPRGTDRSPEYNEHFCYKLDSRVKNLTMEWNEKQQQFITHAYRSLLWIQFVTIAFRSEEVFF